MVLKSRTTLQLLFCVIFLFIPLFAGAVNFSQLITLEKDGSGVFKLIYSEKETIVKGKNYIIGNLPFTKEKSDEYFKSANSFVKAITIENSSKDNTLIEVTVSIGFKDINKISEIKALTNAIIGLNKTDTGYVFKYVITPVFTKANSLDNVYTILTYNGKLISSNGDTGKENVSWYRSKEYLNIKDIYLYATFESEVKTVSKDNDTKEKSCGLFGLELPIIISLGFVFSKFAKRRKE